MNLEISEQNIYLKELTFLYKKENENRLEENPTNNAKITLNILDDLIRKNKNDPALKRIKTAKKNKIEKFKKLALLFFERVDPIVGRSKGMELPDKIGLVLEYMQKNRFSISHVILTNIHKELKTTEKAEFCEKTKKSVIHLFETSFKYLKELYFENCFIEILKIANYFRLLEELLKFEFNTSSKSKEKTNLIEHEIKSERTKIINELKKIDLEKTVNVLKELSTFKCLIKSKSMKLIDCVLNSIKDEDRKIIYKRFIKCFNLNDGKKQLNEFSMLCLFFDIGKLFDTAEEKLHLFFANFNNEGKEPFLFLLDYCDLEQNEIEKCFYSIFLDKQDNEELLNKHLNIRDAKTQQVYEESLKQKLRPLFNKIFEYILQQWPSLTEKEKLEVLNPHKKQSNLRLSVFKILFYFMKKKIEHVGKFDVDFKENEDLTLIKMYINKKQIEKTIIENSFFQKNIKKIASYSSIAFTLSKEIAKEQQLGLLIWQEATSEQREHLWSSLPIEECCRIYSELSLQRPLTDWSATRNKLQHLLDHLDEDPLQNSDFADLPEPDEKQAECEQEVDCDEEVENDEKVEEESLEDRKRRSLAYFFKTVSEQALVDLASQLPEEDGILIESLRHVTKKRLFEAAIPHIKPATLCFYLSHFTFDEKCRFLQHTTLKQKETLFHANASAIYPKCVQHWLHKQELPQYIEEAKLYLLNDLRLKKAIENEQVYSSIIQNINDCVKEFEKQKEPNKEKETVNVDLIDYHDDVKYDFFGKELINPIEIHNGVIIDLESWYQLLENSTNEVKDPFTMLPISTEQLSKINQQIEQLQRR